MKLNVGGTNLAFETYGAVDDEVADLRSPYTAFVGTPVRGARASATAMFDADATFISPAISFVGALPPRAGGTSLVGGSVDVGTPYQVFALNVTGTITAHYGSTDRGASSGFCNIAALSACGAGNGFCVADFNCHRFSVFSAAGEYVDGFDFMDGRQPYSLTPAGGGKVYLLHSGPDLDSPRVLCIVSAIPFRSPFATPHGRRRISEIQPDLRRSKAPDRCGNLECRNHSRTVDRGMAD